MNLPKEKTYWMDTAEQLKKYDDDLLGWVHTNLKKHDILFTTMEPRIYAFMNYIKELVSAREDIFRKKPVHTS